MARPKSIRLVEELPAVKCFKPAVNSAGPLDEVFITLDEIEAIRLADLEGQYQEQAAKKMNVSRQTVGRILGMAHKKIADALINGKIIKLEGGAIQFYNGGYFKRCGDDWQFEEHTVDHSVEITKVAVSSAGPTMDSEVDLRFGRSRYIMVINLKNDSVKILKNSNNDSAEVLEDSASGKSIKGRGGLLSEKVIETGAQVLITGNIGHKAIRLLTAAGVRVFLVDSSLVKNALEEFKNKIIRKNNA